MVSLLRDMNGQHPANPVIVLSNVPNAGGIDLARELGVHTAIVDHRKYGNDRTEFEADIMRELKAVNVDLVCLAGFMRILTSNFVQAWQKRMLNIHPSLLPKYPALHTHDRALEAGDQRAGCTVHLVTPELDAGPILGQAEVAITEGETPESLAAKVLKQEHKLYPQVLRKYVSGDETPVFLPI